MWRLTENTISRYLIEEGLAVHDDVAVERLDGRNFVAAVRSDGFVWVVKQPTHAYSGPSDVAREAQILKRIASEGTYATLQKLTPEVVAFDRNNQILITEFWKGSESIHHYHRQLNSFPVKLAREVADTLATVHRESFKNSGAYRKLSDSLYHKHTMPNILELRITPEFYSWLPQEDALRFVKLFQKYKQVADSLYESARLWQPTCLIHNDFRFANLIFLRESQNIANPPLRVVDWELSDWGDPAWDVGTIFGDYLLYWIDSLAYSDETDSRDWFLQADVPLAKIQPAMRAFWTRYTENCEEIVGKRSDFAYSVARHAGAYLLNIAWHKFRMRRFVSGYVICLLQTSKNLLTEPGDSTDILLGGATK